MRKDNKGIGKFIFGAALGAGLGLLFAPKKGSENRKEVKEKLDDLLDQAKNIDKEEVKKEFDKKVKEIKKMRQKTFCRGAKEKEFFSQYFRFQANMELVILEMKHMNL